MTLRIFLLSFEALGTGVSIFRVCLLWMDDGFGSFIMCGLWAFFHSLVISFIAFGEFAN
jgi:hypothetical protein